MGIYLRWLLTYVCASVYDCFGLPACAYEEGTKLLGVYRKRFLRIMPPFIFSWCCTARCPCCGDR